MQRFVLQQNIKRFRALMSEERSAKSLTTLRTLLLDAERNLALMDASGLGVLPEIAELGPTDRFRRRAREFAHLFETAQENCLLIDPNPGLHIIDLNEAYAAATMTSRNGISGERLFDVFPDNPEDSAADGVNNLYHSLQLVAQTQTPHSMPIQRYDVRDPSGSFVVRCWRPVNLPVFSDDGELVGILHQVEDVTAQVLAQKGNGDVFAKA